MAHLTELFAEASSSIEPEEDAENAKLAHEEIRGELAHDIRLSDLGLKTLLIGSYGRNVSIQRVKDVDIFAMLEDAGDDLDGDDILDHIKGLLCETHASADVSLQDHSVVVDLDEYDLSVDVVPARPYKQHWEIPDSAAGWIETNPLELGKLTTHLNTEFTLGGTGVFVPMVKMLRQIRRACSIERPSGLYVEILTYWAFESGEVEGTSRASYLDCTLSRVIDQLQSALDQEGLDDPTLPGESIATKATAEQLETALDLMTDASDLASKALAEKNECESAKKWRELLGKDSEGSWVFPLPDDCDDSESKSHIYVPGEKRAPHGDDRFA